MKIYTKTGDKGETSLIGGRRVSKAHQKIEAYGTVDELNSWVGVMADYTINASRQPLLRKIQANLFVIGSQLANDNSKPNKKLPVLEIIEVVNLEEAIDSMTEELEALTSFILPGGHKEVSFAHVARTVCRRAERHCILLTETEEVSTETLMYLNRLSDYLFVLARTMAKDMKVEEIKWIP